MDMFTVVEICICFLMAVAIGLMVLVGWLLVLDWMKKCRKKKSGEFVWIYPLKVYRLSVDLSRSTYLNDAPTSVDRYSNLGSYPTIDDPVMIEIAERLSEMCEGRSEKWKANFLLAFVQQNVKYAYDKDQYGVAEYWALPIQTLSSRMGDCEDTAFVYAGLAQLMGIRVKLFITRGHAVPAVKEPTIKGKTLVVDDDVWYPAETTSYMPITGAYTLSNKVVASADVVTPTWSFLGTLVKKY